METISEQYRQEQARLHENPAYGVASVYYAPLVDQIIATMRPKDMLDYGCGKGRLSQNIRPDYNLKLEMYDPAIPEVAAEPTPRELVCCIDVLEHIEPHFLDNVLDHLQHLTLSVGFFTIHTGPAAKKLSDGRNAHLIQKNFRWWLPRLWSRFDIHSMTHTDGGFYVIVKRKDKHGGTEQLREPEGSN